MLAGLIGLSHPLFSSLKQAHHFGELILLPISTFGHIFYSGRSHNVRTEARRGGLGKNQSNPYLSERAIFILYQCLAS